MSALNLGLRFAVELAALAGLAYAGWQVGSAMTSRVALAVVAPLLFAAVWGLLISPKARWRVPDPGRGVVEVVLFGLVAGGLTAAGASAVGLAFVAVAVANLTLMVALRQRGR